MATKKQKKKITLLFTNKGFSGFFLLVVIAMSIFLAGAFETTQTLNPQQVIPDPNSTFLDPTGKESLQLKTIGFITPTQAVATVSGSVNCANENYDTEPGIFVGSDPAPGGTITNGALRIWINDE